MGYEDKVESPRLTSYLNRDYVVLKNQFSEVLPFQMQIYAQSGHGKGLAVEGIIEKWRKDTDGVVLYIADPKDEAEGSFVMYPPKEKYHLQRLRIDGAEPTSYKCKLYHPFTFNIPKRYLPPINFFTIPLKSLGREEWSILAETPYDSDSIRLLQRVGEDLGRNEGLFAFLHEAQRLVEGKKESKRMSADPKNFYLKAKGGTAKSIVELSSLLFPFRNNYFLRRESCDMNLNWEEILKDNQSYHVFLGMWLTDAKLKQFMVLHLLKKIIENRHYTKKPILIIIPEIRVLCPRNPQGYKFHLAQAITDALSTMRSQGRGMSSILDSQNWSDTDDRVKGSATVTFFGQLNSKDQEGVCKANQYKREVREKLQNMHENAYLKYGEEDFGTYRAFFPRHMHKEPKYNWIEMYEEHYKSFMVRYVDMINSMRKEFEMEEREVREIVSKEAEKQRLEEEQKKLERQSKKEQTKEPEVKKEKQTPKEKERLMKLAHEMKFDLSLPDRERSDRKVAEKLGLDPKTTKKYYEEYSKKINQAVSDEPVINQTPIEPSNVE